MEPEATNLGSVRRGWRAIWLYPSTYSWLLFLAAMDIMMTWIIMHEAFGGYEVNWVANWVIRSGGLKAVILYKFSLIAIVIGICDIIGRMRYRTGERLAAWCVAIQCIPVVVAFAQLLIDVYVWAQQRDAAPEAL